MHSTKSASAVAETFTEAFNESGRIAPGLRVEAAFSEAVDVRIATYGGTGSEHIARDELEVACCGAPVFAEPALTMIAGSQGPAAAWLELYRVRGIRSPEFVHGRFAIVVVDKRKRTAFAAVDRFGIGSLCYAGTATTLAIADRADNVIVRPEIDDQAIFDYLWFHMIPAPRTIFKGVNRLLPGHRLIFERGRCKTERYWTPRFEDARRSLPELSAEFRELLRSAVSALANTATFGCYLSGGTDSSSIAGMASAITGQATRTYSIGFDVPGYDEMAYARIASRHFGCDHHEYYVSPRDIVENMARLARYFDQPFGNSSVLPAFCCARMAREDGIARLLAGDGGDELFGGNARYARQQLFELYSRAPAAIRRISEPLFVNDTVRRLPLVSKATKYIEQARVQMPDRMDMYNLLLRIGLTEIFEPRFLERIDTAEPRAQQRGIYGSVSAGALIDRMLAYDWKYTLADNDLPKVIHSARLAGVEVAFPFLDHRLVDFSLRLAPWFKLRGFQLRWFFKQALVDFLPPEVLRKKKHGFGLPFGTWAAVNGELRELVGDALSSLRKWQIVQPTFIDTLLNRRLVEHPGYYGEMVWILTMLALWQDGRARTRTTAT